MQTRGFGVEEVSKAVSKTAVRQLSLDKAEGNSVWNRVFPHGKDASVSLPTGWMTTSHILTCVAEVFDILGERIISISVAFIVRCCEFLN